MNDSCADRYRLRAARTEDTVTPPWRVAIYSHIKSSMPTRSLSYPFEIPVEAERFVRTCVVPSPRHVRAEIDSKAQDALVKQHLRSSITTYVGRLGLTRRVVAVDDRAVPGRRRKLPKAIPYLHHFSLFPAVIISKPTYHTKFGSPQQEYKGR